MRIDSVGVVPERTHDEAIWQKFAADKGSGDRGGGGNYLCGFLTLGAQDSEMPGAGLSRNSS